MVQSNRIWAVVVRHLLMQFRDTYRVFDITFWPLLDITLWGFVGFWVQQTTPSFLPLVFIPVLGAFFWQMVIRGSVELAVSVLEEIWSKNLCNLLSSPLLFIEWVIATMIISIMRLSIVIVLTGIAIWYLYGCNILLFGWWLVPLIFLLLMSGWSLGFVSSALIMRWGQRVQNFAWVMGWAFAAFCGVFYSASVLPEWMQSFGKLLPMTYTFKSIHYFVEHGSMPHDQLFISLCLNSIYFVLTLGLLLWMFKQARVRGLAQLELD